MKWPKLLQQTGTCFCFFTPATWGNDPIWLIFFRWVETTCSGDVLLRALGGFGRKYRKLRELLGLNLGDFAFFLFLFLIVVFVFDCCCCCCCCCCCFISNLEQRKASYFERVDFSREPRKQYPYAPYGCCNFHQVAVWSATSLLGKVHLTPKWSRLCVRSEPRHVTMSAVNKPPKFWGKGGKYCWWSCTTKDDDYPHYL